MLKSSISLQALLLAAIAPLLFLIGCSDMGSDAVNNPGNDPPQITSADSVIAVEGQPFAYQATATDPDGATPTIAYENYASWMTPSDGSIAGQAVSGTPDTSFIVTASDGELADTLAVYVAIISQANLVSYSASVQPVFTSTCAVSGCHTGMTPAAGLRLMTYSHLMTGGQSGPPVIPFQPDSSLLIQKLEGAVPPRMPYGGDPLPTATIQMFRDWISQGALDN